MRTDLRGFLHATGGLRGVVCVAPHPDDESAGCGGLLAGCAALGVPVSVVVTTDGAASHRSEAWPPDRLARRRRAELRGALTVLGVETAPVHLDLPDAAPPRGPREAEAVSRLAQHLRNRRPGLVVTTWTREPHCDHQHASKITRRAARGLPLTLAQYLVWTPLRGRPDAQPTRRDGRLIDLQLGASMRAAKRGALRCHASQRGEVVTDDPDGFALTAAEEAAMTGPTERYVLPRAGLRAEAA